MNARENERTNQNTLFARVKNYDERKQMIWQRHRLHQRGPDCMPIYLIEETFESFSMHNGPLLMESKNRLVFRLAYKKGFFFIIKMDTFIEYKINE